MERPIHSALAKGLSKFDIISRFMKRQVDDKDVKSWLLPFCAEAHRDGVTDEDIEAACSRVVDLPAIYDSSKELVSEEGRVALCDMLLRETYKAYDPEEPDIADDKPVDDDGAKAGETPELKTPDIDEQREEKHVPGKDLTKRQKTHHKSVQAQPQQLRRSVRPHKAPTRMNR